MESLAEPVEQSISADGHSPQGALFLSVKNTGAFTATSNGVPLVAGEAKSYPFVGKGYKSTNYTVNGSTLNLMYIL